VVRHPLVQKIIVAYEKRDAEREASAKATAEQRAQKPEGAP
jgi:phosphate starvation-inducible protein PhoH